MKLPGADSVQKHATRYRVDGEIGRFTFSSWDVKSGDKKIYSKGLDMFPERIGQQWHQTRGFKELGLIVGAAQLPAKHESI